MTLSDRARSRYSGIRRTREGRPGQALTEMALVLPILILILMGVLDLGRAYHTQIALSNAARVGLVYGQQVVSPRNCLGDCPFIKVGEIVSNTVAEAQGGISITDTNVTVCVSSDCPASSGDLVGPDMPITISITVPFTTITPFVHLRSVTGTESGRTFSYDPAVPTPTPGGPTATPVNTAISVSTSTPAPTSTAPTATPVPAPILSNPQCTMYANNSSWECGTNNNKKASSVTISWSTNDPQAGDTIYVRPQGSADWSTFVQANGNGETPSFAFKLAPAASGTNSYPYLNAGTYEYYLKSTSTSGLSNTLPASCPSSCSGTMPPFYTFILG